MRSITTTISNSTNTPKKLTFFGVFMGIQAIQELPVIYRNDEDLTGLPDAEQVFVHRQEENKEAPIILSQSDSPQIKIDEGFRQLENSVLVNPIRVMSIKIRSSNQEQYFNSNLTYTQRRAQSSSESRVTITTGYNPSHNNPVLELFDGNQFSDLIFDGSSYLQLENLKPKTTLTVEFEYITQQDMQQVNKEEPTELKPETSTKPMRKFLGDSKRPWWSYVTRPPWFPI